MNTKSYIKFFLVFTLLPISTFIAVAQDSAPVLSEPAITDITQDFSIKNGELSSNSCYQNATKFADSYANEQLDVKGKVHAFFYDSLGQPCFTRKTTRISEGDLFVVGYFGDLTGAPKFKVKQTTCELENPDGRIRDQFITIPKDEEQSGETEALISSTQIGFRELDNFDCYGSEIKFKVTSVDNDEDIDEKTIKQYARYYATWQVGVVWTGLQDRSYSLVDKGNGNVISTNIDNSKGPLYVGSVTVYGFPRYIQSWFGGKRYSGRDIINHNDLLDRVGLNLSFGLEDPTETIGLGLSFELVRGVSLTYSQLYREIDVLDGLSVGDSFSASDIPTMKKWDNEGVVGISIDGRLISTFFGGGD